MSEQISRQTTPNPSVLSMFRVWVNGSDLRGVAFRAEDGLRPNLDDPEVYVLGYAFVRWLCRQRGCEAAAIRLGIGHDSRHSAGRLKRALAAGAISAGAALVYDFSLASTPAMFWACCDPELSVDAAIMITASHLPKNRNGFKFFRESGGLEKSDMLSITELCAEIYSELGLGTLVGEDAKARIESVLEAAQAEARYLQFDFMKRYAASLCERVRMAFAMQEQPLMGLHILLDAGNGAGGFFARDVLEALGANTEGSLFLEPDGDFPNHIPNPELEEAMAPLCTRVPELSADLGIVFDTDVDRAALIASNGEEINRNRLIALISDILLTEEPGATIVTDSITSTGLQKFIEVRGGKQHRFKRGYKNVINEAKRLEEEGTVAPLAIETSGHAALRENRWLDDGAYLATRLIIALAEAKSEGRGLLERISDLEEAEISLEQRFRLRASDYQKQGKELILGLESIFSQERLQSTKPARRCFDHCIGRFTKLSPNYEGLRVEFNGDDDSSAWFLLRNSLHDPVLVLNVEGDAEPSNQILTALSEYLLSMGELELSR
ncbi:MAG: phosphomannomutase/phosphoglucomutase [Eubacteriales bacterium]|nr:phosphomannomutase/phosphoglucomutase [Eubacteriales bacterium]